jgi:hypothetical protein
VTSLQFSKWCTQSPFNTALFSTLTITSFNGKLYENAAEIQIVVAGGLFNSQTHR